MEAEIKKTKLHCVIIVKKATDFRVTGEFAWYTAVLKAIMQKDANFDSSKMIMALTFAESVTVSSSEISAFWTKLWEVSGL